jgi:hypothetical protein
VTIDLTAPFMPVIAFGVVGCLIGLGFIVLIRVATGKKRG